MIIPSTRSPQLIVFSSILTYRRHLSNWPSKLMSLDLMTRDMHVLEDRLFFNFKDKPISIQVVKSVHQAIHGTSAWISNYTHSNALDVITHACPRTLLWNRNLYGFPFEVTLIRLSLMKITTKFNKSSCIYTIYIYIIIIIIIIIIVIIIVIFIIIIIIIIIIFIIIIIIIIFIIIITSCNIRYPPETHLKLKCRSSKHLTNRLTFCINISIVSLRRPVVVWVWAYRKLWWVYTTIILSCVILKKIMEHGIR